MPSPELEPCRRVSAETINMRMSLQLVGATQQARSSVQSSLSFLRQRFSHQLENRREVLVLGARQIEIFLSFREPIVSINVVLGNVNSTRVVRVRATEFLHRDLSLAGKKPIDEQFCGIGMGRTGGNAQGSTGGAGASAFFPIVAVEIIYRESLLLGFSGFASGGAANAK